MHLLIATANPAKIREFRQMLDGAGGAIQWTDLSEHPPVAEVEETGRTFLANACLKASQYARQFGTWALADDSGLEVDALEGKPGVYSARWAVLHGAGRGNEANNRLLLRQMEQVPDDRRTARFVCVLALSDPTGRIILTVRDQVEGKILPEPAGTGGFGYDPLFFVPELGQTTAQLPPEQKHRISHRGKALRRLRDLMEQIDLASSDSQPAVGH